MWVPTPSLIDFLLFWFLFLMYNTRSILLSFIILEQNYNMNHHHICTRFLLCNVLVHFHQNSQRKIDLNLVFGGKDLTSGTSHTRKFHLNSGEVGEDQTGGGGGLRRKIVGRQCVWSKRWLTGLLVAAAADMCIDSRQQWWWRRKIEDKCVIVVVSIVAVDSPVRSTAAEPLLLFVVMRW